LAVSVLISVINGFVLLQWQWRCSQLAICLFCFHHLWCYDIL